MSAIVKTLKDCVAVERIVAMVKQAKETLQPRHFNQLLERIDEVNRPDADPKWYDLRQNVYELAEWLDGRGQLEKHDPWFLLEKPWRYQDAWEAFEAETNVTKSVCLTN